MIGLPVIDTRNVDLRDYIHGENGYIVDPLDAKNLAAALSSLMQSLGHCIETGRRHHAENRDSFAPALCSAKFAAMYQELHTQ